MLFGAGGFVAALLLPALVFGVALAAPLGWFSDYAVSFSRMHGLATNPVTKLVLIGLISLTLWHAAHHLRHFALDMGLGRVEAVVSYLLYGAALLGTVYSAAVIGQV
jgi:fumarate reductase subunit D